MALSLLMSHRYDSPRVQSSWFEDGGRERLLEAVGAIDKDDPPPPPEGEDPMDCTVCMGEMPVSEMDSLPCGHWICMGCWTGEVSARAASKAELLTATCPVCSHPITDRLFMKALAPVPQLLERWERWSLDDYTMDDFTARSCPQDGCAYVCKYPKGVARDVICPMGHCFCFACGLEGHAPATCEDAEAWRTLMASDGMNAKWIRANCRPCPRCGMMLEKNQGCMHMVCGKHAHGGSIAKGHGCGLSFCW